MIRIVPAKRKGLSICASCGGTNEIRELKIGGGQTNQIVIHICRECIRDLGILVCADVMLSERR